MKTITKASNHNEVTPREEANRKLAYSAATEGIVLLKNEGVLPIAPGKLALYGVGAAKTIKGGTGSGEVNERYSVSILEGLEHAGFTITTRKWLDDYEAEFAAAKEEYGIRARKNLKNMDMDVIINIMGNPFQYPFGRGITDEDIAASETDTCIYVVSRQAGEGSDRNLAEHHYHLSEIEITSLKKAAVAYKNVILVINVGASIDMGFLEEVPGINAVLFFCQQGMEGGNAFADIITGKVNPSGCLSSTWAKKYEDIPFANEYSYLNGALEQEYYKDGIYVGYRYFDSFGVAPQYEFGYGLSYTDFEIRFSAANLVDGLVSVKAEVTNVGLEYSGKKVVQLYASCPSGKLIREYQHLAAFTKTKNLAPGEKQGITLTFGMTELAGYDEEKAAYILEAGDFVLYLGESSRKHQPCAVIKLAESVITEKCINICPTVEPFEELTALSIKANKNELPEDIVRLTLDPADIVMVYHQYEKVKSAPAAKVAEMVAKLTQEEQLKLVCGIGGFVTNPTFNAPGAAGNTTYDLYEKGLCNVALCDGPAGLRLQRTSALTKDGMIKPMEAMMECFNYIPDEAKAAMFGNAAEDTLLYQYATAFPVGTALAQSWNTELLEEVGQAIGTEMVEYGVTFWLAPGMNLQKNPLCGRNYEYFSEDPLLTGKLAAALTRGVQSNEGCYVTIKHFAANNQETNRIHVSSNLSERVLREIYLRGFEIAVCEGGAKSVMTSYNKINGEYTCNSYDLCTRVLRNEWKFHGVVMSDWFATAPGQGSNGLALKAGNDLLMPGGPEYMEALQQDLANGVVTEEELLTCCENVVEAILNSRTQKEIFS